MFLIHHLCFKHPHPVVGDVVFSLQPKCLLGEPQCSLGEHREQERDRKKKSSQGLRAVCASCGLGGFVLLILHVCAAALLVY